MLSDHERETLLDMERRLRVDDPIWAQSFVDAEHQASRRRALAWTAHIVGLVLAVALFVLLVAARDPGPALVVAAMAALMIWHLRRLRRSAAPADTGPGPHTGGSPA